MHEYDQIGSRSSVSATPLQTAFKFGTLGGIISILISLTAFYAEMHESAGLSFLSMLVFFGSIFLGMKVHRDQDLNGAITYGRTVWVGVLTTFFMSLTKALWDMVYAFIDPSLREEILSRIMESFQKSGLEEDQMEEMIAMVDKMMIPHNFLIITLIASVIFGLLVSALMAFFVSRSNNLNS